MAKATGLSDSELAPVPQGTCITLEGQPRWEAETPREQDPQLWTLCLKQK